jgi:hypothetical protein
MTRKTITYKGLSIRDPAPYGEAGLAWQNNFIAIADTLDSLQGSLDTALGGLVIGTDIQAYSTNLDAWSSVTPSVDGKSLVAAANYASIRDLLDLEVGKDVQAHSANLDTWSSVAPSANGKSLVAAADYAAMRGLLDLVVGVDIQAYSANLDVWSGVAPSADGQSLVAAVDYAAMRGLLGVRPGADVQGYSAALGAIAGLTPIDGNVIVGDGSTWVAESGATARASLGLGSMATQAAGDVAITGGAITGITDLAVTDGGTGASDAAGARGNLGFTAPILDRTAPGDIGATTPAAGKFTTLQSGEHSILSDTVGLKLDAAGTTTLYGNGSYLVTNRGMVNPGTLVETAGKNQSMVYGHDGTYAYLVYQPYVWSGSAWTATNCHGFGTRALEQNTGTDCVGVGSYALYDNTGNECAGLGDRALSNNQGTTSYGIGSTVLQYNTGDSSIGFGARAGRYNTGNNLVALGHRSAERNIGIDTSLVGLRAGYNNTGKQVAGLGNLSLYNNTGDNVVALGYFSGRYNTGNYNTFLGSHIGSNFDANDSAAKAFDYTAVDPGTDRITIPAHGFGNAGRYTNLKFTQGTAAITGLTSGNLYQAKIIDADTIGLNEPDGPDGRTRTTANITDAGTGTGHTFTPQYEYSNATCVGANSAPSASNQVTLGDTAVTEVKTSGVILPGGYKAADGSPGINKTITFKDADGTTHTLTFKDGLLTSHTTA